MSKQPTPEELHNAFKELDLPPGSDLKAVKKNYRYLSFMFSADRAGKNEEFIERSTEKHKKINNARDILREHFDNWHREENCDCQEPNEKIYEEKKRAAEESFNQEREAARQRAAKEAAAQEAKRKDEERRKRQEESEAEATAQARSEQFTQDFAQAQDYGKKVQDHETFCRYTIYSLQAFGLCCLLLLANLALSNWITGSKKNFDQFESKEYKDYHKADMDHIEDKADYLEKHISKKMRGWANELVPPYEKNYYKVLRKYRNSLKPPPQKRPRKLIDTGPKMTREDSNQLSNLESWYTNQLTLKVTQKELSDMLLALRNAKRIASGNEHKQVSVAFDDVTAEHLQITNRLNYLNDQISKVETRLRNKFGSRIKLPSKPATAKPFVIQTKAAYHNLRSSFPHLFD